MLNRGDSDKKMRAPGAFFEHSQKTIRHKKDFDWRPRKDNPYKKKDTGVNWRARINYIALAISIVGIFTVILYHPFFHINKYEITGLQRIDEVEFTNAVDGILETNHILILPNKSYLIIDTDEVHDIILSRFPVESVIVEKIFPGKLRITVQEKISTIIYDNGKQYSYLGLDGNIVEILRNVGDDEWVETKEIVTSTLEDGTEISTENILERRHTPPIKKLILEMGDYPIVYDTRDKEGTINTVMLKEDIVKGIIEWFNLIQIRTDIPFGYIVLEDELGNADIKTGEGWRIKINLLERINDQFEDLQFILKEEVTKPNLNYIDLRYKDRAYWQ